MLRFSLCWHCVFHARFYEVRKLSLRKADSSVFDLFYLVHRIHYVLETSGLTATEEF